MCSRALTHQYVLIDDEVLHLTLAYEQGKRVRACEYVYAQKATRSNTNHSTESRVNELTKEKRRKKAPL